MKVFGGQLGISREALRAAQPEGAWLADDPGAARFGWIAGPFGPRQVLELALPRRSAAQADPLRVGAAIGEERHELGAAHLLAVDECEGALQSFTQIGSLQL